MDWNALWANAWTLLTTVVLARAIGVVLIVAGAFLISWIFRVVVRRVVERIISGAKKSQNVDDTQALLASPLAVVRIVQRSRTLGSVLTNLINVAIAVVGIILVIQTVWPGVLGSFALLTAAIGAGLGFGAQNIVKDVLNGLFMVVEDQLGVGDVVDVGPVTGVVEVVGIRITQVRDVNGTLWFVRNGEIARVGNMSQGWSRVIIDLAVPYEADVDLVQERMLAVAQDLAKTPKWRSVVIDKPEIWGIESVSDSAVVVRLVVKTRTHAKDDVSRELRMLLKQASDELGVTLPSLSTVVLSGWEGAMSVNGARPPRTRPIPTVDERPRRTRGRRTTGAPGTSRQQQQPTQQATQQAPEETP